MRGHPPVAGLEADIRLDKGGFRLRAGFELATRGITALFGPSGSGKSLLLRCLAGLEPDCRGHIRFGGRDWQRPGRFLPPHRRRVGFVFQDSALFPHLDVRGNLLYGWRRHRGPGPRLALEQVSGWLGLDPLLDRDCLHLSGGERQRVAIGRALLAGPDLLLMDEPLAALDHQGRAAILPYLERLHRALAIPVVYVSHDLEEIARLADRLLLLEDGRVTGQDDLHALCTRLDLPLAHLDQAGAVIEARVAGTDPRYRLSRLSFGGGSIELPLCPHPPGTPLRLRILARDVSLTLERPRATSILNLLPATVLEIADDNPAQVMVRLRVGDQVLLSRITRKSRDRLGLAPGRALFAQVKAVALL